MEQYTPGLHIVATFTSEKNALSDAAACGQFFRSLIKMLDLQEVGAVFHSFPEGGFTGVICLTESHVSIHTWPEFGLATFDVFLSSYRKDNSEKVRLFYKRTLEYFNAIEIKMQEVVR
jgi:S-adenosylmethionine decarboxylase